jgi:hypothetical protein
VIRFYVHDYFFPAPLRVLGAYFSDTSSLQDGGNEGDLFVPTKIGHKVMEEIK